MFPPKRPPGPDQSMGNYMNNNMNANPNDDNSMPHPNQNQTPNAPSPSSSLATAAAATTATTTTTTTQKPIPGMQHGLNPNPTGDSFVYPHPHSVETPTFTPSFPPRMPPGMPPMNSYLMQQHQQHLQQQQRQQQQQQQQHHVPFPVKKEIGMSSHQAGSQNQDGGIPPQEGLASSIPKNSAEMNMNMNIDGNGTGSVSVSANATGSGSGRTADNFAAPVQPLMKPKLPMGNSSNSSDGNANVNVNVNINPNANANAITNATKSNSATAAITKPSNPPMSSLVTKPLNAAESALRAVEEFQMKYRPKASNINNSNNTNINNNNSNNSNSNNNPASMSIVKEEDTNSMHKLDAMNSSNTGAAQASASASTPSSMVGVQVRAQSKDVKMEAVGGGGGGGDMGGVTGPPTAISGIAHNNNNNNNNNNNINNNVVKQNMSLPPSAPAIQGNIEGNANNNVSSSSVVSATKLQGMGGVGAGPGGPGGPVYILKDKKGRTPSPHTSSVNVNVSGANAKLPTVNKGDDGESSSSSYMFPPTGNSTNANANANNNNNNANTNTTKKTIQNLNQSYLLNMEKLRMAEDRRKMAAMRQMNPGPPPPAVKNEPMKPAVPAPNPASARQGQGQGITPPTPVVEPNGQTVMRELRVEDALSYLDLVKVEFGDRPRIYNEFLEIMKNFKAHEIDTPGVIRRVSQLFRGYNNLILGFNTFLPEGFKIEQKDLMEGGHLAGFSAPQPPSGPSHNNQMESMPVGRMNQEKLYGGQNMFPHQGAAQQQGGNGMQVNPNRPGHHLPPNHVGNVGNVNVHHPQGGGNRHPPAPFQARDAVGHPQHQAMPAHMSQGQHQNMAQQMPTNKQQPSQAPPVPQAMDMNQQASLAHPAPQQASGQQPEFDHAISYVTTIKRRFSSEPRTYQQFLEILHTYQKEQRGIREVLEQVSTLFADHPDLLKEFTYFLPEAVQEQAKERLHAAAAEAEARISAAKQQQNAAQNKGFDPMQTLFPKHQSGSWKESNAQSKELIDMTEKQQQLSAMDARAQAVKSSPSQIRKRPHSPTNIPQQYSTFHMQPEVLVYNAGVERQFFDAAKEALTSFSRDGELAWAEFLKCMDMYAQEILSKNEMLSIMEDLLGKQHRDLLDEFKRILTAAGAPGAHVQDDAWHSVPLSEIDFSRCRRCTPSYRALPRDYPCPPFSERSEEEAKVLNDVWISLPDGSEESYTFRHMRKNQHEEVLFRCEDERFEIDMVIDSNACTLKRLEPISEEIALLQQKEISRKFSQGANGNKSSNGGAGGKLYKYSFDKRILNTIHRHCISRIYGDSGNEMLELMYKNPVVAIPIVVKRLRQKDKEFRESREKLNRRWKELAEINYYKSLDHRSLTWRTIDKRATSTRTLASDIKDRAANNGIESESAIAVRRDKAKDEHGSFYEVTMGRYLSRKMDLSNLPKPSTALFTPHMSVLYENNFWAQRDAYRIISFALERGPTSPTDKDRCHSVWRHFLSKLFGLSLRWMHSPAIAYATSPSTSAPSIISNGDESGHDDDESSAEENEMIGDDVVVTEEVIKDCRKGGSAYNNNQSHIIDHQPIPPGAEVLTIFGEGTVVKYHKSEQIFEVLFRFSGTGFLNRNSILCSILSCKKSPVTEELMSEDEKGLEREDDMLILGPQCLYLFFRLHQILIRRLNIAYKLAHSVGTDKTLSTLVEHISPDGNENVGQKRYEAFLSLVYGVIEGSYASAFPGSSSNAEGGKYEDRLRCLLGHNAYELATMDKLISHILKNLQNMANDSTMQEMIQIFRRQADIGHMNGGFKPNAFKKEASMISEGENMFAFQYCKIPKSDKSIMHMEFLGCIVDDVGRNEENSASLVENNERGERHTSKKLRRG